MASLLRNPAKKSMLRKSTAYSDPVSAIKSNAAAKNAREAGSSMYRRTSGMMPTPPRGAFDTGITPRPTIGMEPRVSGGKPRETQGLGYERGNKHTAYSRSERLQVLADRRANRNRARAAEAGVDASKIPGGTIDGVEKDRLMDPKNAAFDRRVRDSILRREQNEANRHPDQKDTPGNSPLNNMPKPGSGVRSTRSVLREIYRKNQEAQERKRQSVLRANEGTGAKRRPFDY